jgi:GNAT superfamily N-acetyltransferase
MALVRAAVEKDIPRILELYQQLSLAPGDYPRPSLEQCRRILKTMNKLPGYELLVAEEKGKVVGTVVLAVLPGFTHGTSSFAVVEFLVVDEKYRRRGIGKKLMDYCTAKARKSGCYKIMLTSDNRREDAHRFYKSLGFETSAQGFRMYF